MATIYEHRIAEPVVNDRRLAFADFAEAECPQSGRPSMGLKIENFTDDWLIPAGTSALHWWGTVRAPNR